VPTCSFLRLARVEVLQKDVELGCLVGLGRNVHDRLLVWGILWN
jgi:hypothetical protein